MKRNITGSFLIIMLVALLISPLEPALANTTRNDSQSSVHTVTDPSIYLSKLSKATYQSLELMVEPSTGLPQDRFDAKQFDITPQFAVSRTPPHINKASDALLESLICKSAVCMHAGAYGLRLKYKMPAGNWGSYNLDSAHLDVNQFSTFDVSQATYLEFWVKGAKGGEQFEFVLWSDCNGSFPGRPTSAEIRATSIWRRLRIPLQDFIGPNVDITSLCRLSIGFNDALSASGTVYFDQIAFIDSTGNRIHVSLDETTNVSNVGLYIGDVIGALNQGWEDYPAALAKLDKTLTSLEALPKSHGFPHTHNHVVSLQPAMASNMDDRCRNDLTGLAAEEPNLFSTVDLGNLAAGLILLRQRIPELAGRAGALVDAMEWDWLYDGNAGLMYGCRASDGSPSSWWHYDWLAADSRLAHAIAIGSGKVPSASWNNLNREHETPRCTSVWHFEPGWDGGGLFMALLPGIFLDEAESELGASAKNFAKDQICQAKKVRAPAWGWSASVLPDDIYCGYGCLNMNVLIPHASILAADYVSPTALVKNLQALQTLRARPRLINGTQQIDIGYRASVNWKTSQVAHVYLFLDQSMAFLSLVNYRDHGSIRQYLCQDTVILQVKALISDYQNSC